MVEDQVVNLGYAGSSPVMCACEVVGLALLVVENPPLSSDGRTHTICGCTVSSGTLLLLGVTGNTRDSDSRILGSNPREAALACEVPPASRVTRMCVSPRTLLKG